MILLPPRHEIHTPEEMCNEYGNKIICGSSPHRAVRPCCHRFPDFGYNLTGIAAGDKEKANDHCKATVKK
jgi:hypothetical protein